MARLTLILVIVAVGLSLSCSSDSELTAANTEDTVILSQDALSAGANALDDLQSEKSHIKMVPIEGGGGFAPDMTAGFTACTTGPGGDVIVDDQGQPMILIPSLLKGASRYTHLGRSMSEITVEECWPNDLGALSGWGCGYHYAANGDLLNARFFEDTDMTGAMDFTSIEFVGGTGRFENATGFAAGTGQQDLETLTGEYHIQGVISSVGSSK